MSNRTSFEQMTTDDVEIESSPVQPDTERRIQTISGETSHNVRRHSPRLYNPWDEREVRDAINIRARAQ